MSEAAESSESESESESSVLGDLLGLWALSLLIGVVAGAGLSPALKGSSSGLDWWIDRVDLAAGVTGQFAAMATWLLTIHLMVRSFRKKAERLLATCLAVLGIWPLLSLMGAQRTALPAELWLGAVAMAAASCLLTGTANRGTRPALGLVLILAGLSLLLEVGHAAWPGPPPEALPRLRSMLGIGVATVALLLQPGQSPRGYLHLPGVAGVCGVLFLTALRAGEADAPTWILMVGRTLMSMTQDAHWAVGAWAPVLQLCIALAAIAWGVVSRMLPVQPPSTAPFVAAVCAFALAVPVTPLSVAAITLLGIAALPRTTAAGRSSQSGRATAAEPAPPR